MIFAAGGVGGGVVSDTGQKPSPPWAEEHDPMAGNSLQENTNISNLKLFSE